MHQLSAQSRRTQVRSVSPSVESQEQSATAHRTGILEIDIACPFALPVLPSQVPLFIDHMSHLHVRLHTDLTPTHGGIGSETSDLKPTGFKSYSAFPDTTDSNVVAYELHTHDCIGHIHVQNCRTARTFPVGVHVCHLSRPTIECTAATTRRCPEPCLGLCLRPRLGLCPRRQVCKWCQMLRCSRPASR